MFKVMVMSEIAKNIKAVRIVCDAAPQPVELVAVSKRQSQEKILAALEAGQRVFGENKVQEAYEHWQTIKDNGAYPDLMLHLIGPLQTNKAKDAIALFDVIETVDREKLARSLAKEMKKQGRHLPCYIQVNTGEEVQKAGIFPDDLTDFYVFCQDECGLNIVGLMCIPPVDEPAAMHFGLLSNLASNLGLQKLSMGMSGDYEIAIELGATNVRVGSGIFGVRDSL